MISPEDIGGTAVIVHILDASPQELVTIATGLANEGGVALIAGGTDRIHVVASSGTPAVNASEIVREVCTLLGGKGGGKPGLAQGSGVSGESLDAALARGKELISEKLLS